MYKYTPYSYSKISLFQKCPYAWKLAYLDHIEPKKHPSLELGSLVHKIIAVYIESLKDRAEQSNHSLLEKIIAQYAGDKQDELLPFLSSIKSFILLPSIEPQVEIELALDSNFLPCDFQSDDAFVRGKIDYTYVIEDTAVVIDWKTNQVLPCEDEIKKDWQTRFYTLLLDPLLPDNVTKFVVELNYLRHSKVRKLEIPRDSVNEVRKWILSCVEKIESEENFSPTPGDWCSLCGYLHRCSVARSVLAPVAEEPLIEKLPEKINSLEQAIKLAGALKVIDQVRTKVHNLLKEWVAEHGPVQISGEVLDFHKSETVKWETPEQKAALAALLVRNGVNKEEIWDLFSVNKTAVCSFLKKKNLKHLLEDALATGEKTVNQRFCFRKSN